MECPFCDKFIDNDSLFCDQCGKELMICPVCKKPGKGKACIFDGNKLIRATSISGTKQINKASIPAETENPIAQNSSDIKPDYTLELCNAKLGIRLIIENGDVIGRNKGKHINTLAMLGQISGSHARIDLKDNQWTISDLNSTNGTKVSQTQGNWQNILAIAPNSPVHIADKTFILLANIEFHVIIDNPVVSDKTQRI